MFSGKDNDNIHRGVEGKITSKSNLKKLFNEKNLNPRKLMGQHFLVDENILQKIISAAGIAPGDKVIDIGAGPGALSLELCRMGCSVIAIEWDRGLADLLREQANLKEFQDIHVVEGDVRRMNLEDIGANFWGEEVIRGGEKGKNIKVVANLPYYLTTPLLFQLLQGKLNLELLVLMVQLEVARRIQASPGTKDYGVLSLLCSYYTSPQLLFKVSRNVFFPTPEVDSAVVLLEVLSLPRVHVKDEQIFWTIVRSAFQKRRKIILNALSGSIGVEKEKWKQLLQKARISAERRGETLSLNEFANLCDIFYNEYSGE